MIKTNEIKKGSGIVTKQLGIPCPGIMEDNKKGNTRLIKTFGSQVGMFDEYGSVYAWDIIEAQDQNGEWHYIELTDKQKQSKAEIGGLL